MAATTTPGRKRSGLLAMHGPCQANSFASSPHSHSLPSTVRALLLFRKPLSSTVPMREFALVAIDPAWQTGSVLTTSSSASLLEVSYAPVNAFLLHLSWLSGGRPSPAHCMGCIFITSRSLLPNGSAPLPASNNLISSYTTLILLPCPQSAASSLASPSLPFPLRAVLLFCKLFFSLPGGAGILFIVPASTVSPSHLHPPAPIYSWPVHI